MFKLNKAYNNYLALVVSVFCLAISGCSSPSAIEKNDPTYVLHNTPTLATVSTPRITILPAKTVTPMPVYPPTLTPLATYPPQQAEKIVLDLYEANTCRLPCWWDIVPGKTDWNAAWQFLRRFATNQPPFETRLVESKVQPGYIPFEVHLNVPGQEFPVLDDLSFLIKVDTFNVEYINVNTGNLRNYTIPSILADYGKPDNVYVLMTTTAPIDGYAINIYLFYPDYGFVSTHQSYVKEKSIDGKIRTCSQDFTHLFLWQSGKPLNPGSVLEFGLPELSTYTRNRVREISQVSDMTVDDFYTMLSGEQEMPCISINYYQD